MYINRGNHEAKEMNRTYGFEGEAKHKYGEQTYKASITPSHRKGPANPQAEHSAVRTRIHGECVLLASCMLILYR